MPHDPTFGAGKYAAFIWPAYGITALVIGGLIIGALLHARYWRRKAEAEAEGRK